jgi:hypothetical protein
MTVALLVLLALAQGPPGVARQVFELSGRVDRVNRSARTITITRMGTASEPIYVGPDLAVFDELKHGDFVVLRYYDSYVVEPTPGKKMGPPETVAGAELDALTTDDTRVTQRMRITVTIDAVEPEAGAVTYHGADKRRVFRVVQDRELLDGLKPGDVVTITYTRAQAVSVERVP